MGFTPTQALLMGTRTGDLDPGHSHSSHAERNTWAPTTWKNSSTFRAVSRACPASHNDMREIEKAAQQGHHRALLAYKTFCYQIRKYIGAYVAAMQGLDVVAFTGGIGQGSAGVRSLACQGLGYMGIEIDEKKNRQRRRVFRIHDISLDASRVRILVVPTDEERMIARETIRTISTGYITDIIRHPEKYARPIEVSAHHVHLSPAHVEELSGADIS